MQTPPATRAPLGAPRRSSILTVVGLAAALVPLAPALADDSHWKEPKPGVFQDPANWVAGRVPTNDDYAYFGSSYSATPFNVSFTGDAAAYSLTINRQSPVFDLAGHTFRVEYDAYIGYDEPDPIAVKVLGGTFSSYVMYIGNGGESNASVTVSGPGSRLEARALLFLGGSGYGSLVVDGGATAFGDTIYSSPSYSIPDSGNISVSGAGSLVEAATTFNVAGEPGLQVTDGARVKAQYLNLYGDATLSGDGSLECSYTFNCSGTLSPGSGPGSIAALSLQGDFFHGNSAVMDIELAGPGTCDRFDASGKADVWGILKVTPVGGYSPSLGDSFEFLRYATRTSTFAGIRGLDLGGGRTFRLDWGPSAGTVTVVQATGLTITPDSRKLYAGFTSRHSATVAFDGGSIDGSYSAVWSTDDPSIATVSDIGTVTAVKAGSTTLRVTFGGFTATAPIQVLALPTPLLMERISERYGGGESGGTNDLCTSSPDGRFIVYQSTDPQQLPPNEDRNGRADIILRDSTTGVAARVSLANDGKEADDESIFSSVSDDGRYVAFSSRARNLVAGDSNGYIDIFVRDRVAGTTTRVSVATAGTQSNRDSVRCMISADGRKVLFESFATNLVAGDTNNKLDLFLRDLDAGTTTRVSVSASGEQANNESQYPRLSADGRWVVFCSPATNLVPSDTNGAADVFIKDLSTGAIERINVTSAGGQTAGDAVVQTVSIPSDDGRFVAFATAAPDVVPGDGNGKFDVFLRDRTLGSTTRVSLNSSGGEIAGDSSVPRLSPDGSLVLFCSSADGILPGLDLVTRQLFLRDLAKDATYLLSQNVAGEPGNGPSSSSGATWLTPRYAIFSSVASNLVPYDRRGQSDIFRLDLRATCPADFNRDGKVNINDFIAFQAAFRAADPRADFNRDGKININDFIAFQAAFRAGC